MIKKVLDYINITVYLDCYADLYESKSCKIIEIRHFQKEEIQVQHMWWEIQESTWINRAQTYEARGNKLTIGHNHEPIRIVPVSNLDNESCKEVAVS